MAVNVVVKNTFLALDTQSHGMGSLRRSYSAEGHQVRESSRGSPIVHLEHVWSEGANFESMDVQVIQSEESSFMCSGLAKSRPLSKTGLVSSLTSVSTMASQFGSSNSLSSWCDEEDEEDEESDLSPIITAQTVPLAPKRSDELFTESGLVQAPKDSKHAAVPRNVNLAAEFAKAKKVGQAITTLMVRNIPNRCSQRELISELERAGLAGCFDFVYVPLDLGTMSNVGYAFVNFIHPAFASQCIQVLPKHQFSRQRKSGKPVAVSPAHMQGLEANLRHYEKSAVNTSRLRQRRPVVMNMLKTVSLASLI